MIQFPQPINVNNNNNHLDKSDDRIRFAYHIRTILNILQSTLTASLLSERQTGLKYLFHSANLDGIPKYYEPNKVYNGHKRDNGNIPSWNIYKTINYYHLCIRINLNQLLLHWM